MGVPTLKDLLDEGVSGRGVLVRSDFNVPLDGSTITDPGRILASLPTLKALIDAGAKVIVTAHLGRPKGEVNPKYSLAPVAKRLGELLGQARVAQRVDGHLLVELLLLHVDARAERGVEPQFPQVHLVEQPVPGART